MLPECPEDLRHLAPYLQRADELRSREPLVAYYCGFYAANLAIQKGFPKTAPNETFLLILLDQLQTEKDALKSLPEMQDESLARSYMIQFALKIFLSADNQERAGQSTRKTARLFLVASHFMEVLRVFGEVGEEIEERIKYAKWKASEIVRLINEGGAPTVQPVVPSVQPVETERNLPSMTGSYQPASPPPKPASPPQHFTPPPPLTPVLSPASPVSHQPTVDPSAMASFELAEKHSRYATSAIQFEDIPTAIKEMEIAITLLRSIQEKEEK